jgi:hypothetical protein
MTTTDTAASQRTAALIEGRRADTTRRRERVLAALTQARAAGLEVSVAGIAQAAGVDRTFLYRHRDLLAHVHADQAQPTIPAAQPKVSRASLQADLLAAHERAARLASHIQRLERCLSEALGERLWRESGLGAPQDLDELQQRITQLEQQAIDLRLQLEERDQDLAAARAANRELMTRLNTTP